MISICCFEIKGGSVTVKDLFDELSFPFSGVGHCLRSLHRHALPAGFGRGTIDMFQFRHGFD
jgi:hypothetical protein